MTTGSRGAESSTEFSKSMVNTKGSFVEQAGEGVAAFPLVKYFWRHYSLPLLGTRFTAEALFWVLIMQPKSGLSPMYEQFDPPLSLLPRPNLERFPEDLWYLQRVEMFFSTLDLTPGWFWKGQTILVPWTSLNLWLP